MTTPARPEEPTAPTQEFDLFISYAHQPDAPLPNDGGESEAPAARQTDQAGRQAVADFVLRLKQELAAGFRTHFQRDLEIFFDQDDIRDFDNWQVRCHRALQSSRFFIVCLTRSYLRSDACRWEWEEWCKHEVAHGTVGQGAASLWLVQLEALDDPKDADLLSLWKGDLRQRFHVRFHDWSEHGAAALLNEAARAELARLTEHVTQRLRLLVTERARQGNLPWPNAHFVGREPELERLRAALVDAPATTPVGLHGLGGMGKTALALAFAHAQADAFPGGCWKFNCAGRDDLLGVFYQLVSELDLTHQLSDEQKRDPRLAMQRVFRELRPRGQALFVLDNVDKPELLAPQQFGFLQGEDWARLLYTTRLADTDFTALGAQVQPLDLDSLPEDQAVDLIRGYQPEGVFAKPEHEAVARDIVRLLDGLTLAVETAAVYLGNTDARVIPKSQLDQAVDPAAYLETLREDLLQGGQEGVSSLREVTATLRPTLARLDEPTRTVLQIAALLPPDAIALPWLRDLAGQRHPELAADAQVGQTDPWTQLVRTLIGMSIFRATPEPKVVAMHRVLQRVLDRELREGREKLEQELEAFIRERDTVLNKTTIWTEAKWELGPLGKLAERRAYEGHPQAAWLCSQAGQYWQKVAAWKEAEFLMQQALAIAEASLDANHPAVGVALNNLARLFHETNRNAKAEPLCERAISIFERSLDRNHPDIANGLSTLGQVLQTTNRYEEAEQLLRRALAIDEVAYGKNHPTVARDLINLANLIDRDTSSLGRIFRATHRLSEAENLYRRALLIDESCYGSNHPEVAGDLRNLAAFLQAIGTVFQSDELISESEALARRALAIDEASYGEAHPDVAKDLDVLAVIFLNAGRLAEAEPLLTRALTIWEQTHGKSEPRVASTLLNLSICLQEEERFSEAELCMLRTLHIYGLFKMTTGYPHPQMKIAIRSYFNLLLRMGKTQIQAMATTEKILEPFGLSI